MEISIITDVVQDFGKILFGTAGALIATMIVALSALGALNAKIFAIGRLTQAAARRNYFPSNLGLAGRSIRASSTPSERTALLEPESQARDDPAKATEQEGARSCDRTSQTPSDAPVRAMLLNALLASMCIAFSNFRMLVTYASLGAQSIFLLAVSGLLRHRYRAKIPAVDTTAAASDDPEAPLDNRKKQYQTFTAFPIIFCAVEAFIVGRGAIQHPLFALGVVAIDSVALLGYILLGHSPDYE